MRGNRGKVKDRRTLSARRDLTHSAQTAEVDQNRTVNAYLRDENTRRREEDLAALDSLLGCHALGERERAAFDGMRYFLTTGQPAPTLSARQRKWVVARVAELELEIGDPSVRNRNIPRGREVPTPAVLLNLPKKPPTRRKETP